MSIYICMYICAHMYVHTRIHTHVPIWRDLYIHMYLYGVTIHSYIAIYSYISAMLAATDTGLHIDVMGLPPHLRQEESGLAVRDLATCLGPNSA